MTFSFKSLEKAEAYDLKWDTIDAQALCSKKGSTVVGGVGPFGLLTLASKNLEEYTPVFFRIFKTKDNYKVLMCSDATRYVYSFFFPLKQEHNIINKILHICICQVLAKSKF